MHTDHLCSLLVYGSKKSGSILARAYAVIGNEKMARVFSNQLLYEMRNRKRLQVNDKIILALFEKMEDPKFFYPLYTRSAVNDVFLTVFFPYLSSIYSGPRN